MAQPLQMASFILEEHASGWAAAAPLLLPLRPTALVAEEVAWLQARHRGRVGLGVAAGALPAGLRGGRRAVRPMPSTRSRRSCRGSWPCCGARSWATWTGTPRCWPAGRAPVPVLSAAVSVAAAVRAARCGAGILMEGMSTPDRLARLTRAFGEAGGTGSKVLIRRVWLGRVQSGLVEDQRAVYESYAARLVRRRSDVASDEPGEVAERLAATMREVGADALNLRVQLPGMAPEQVREQIEQIGSTVVAPLKEALLSRDSASPYSPDRRPTAGEVVPAVDVERDPGDLPCVVGQQEAHRRRDVLRLGQPSERESRSRCRAAVGFPDGSSRRGAHQARDSRRSAGHPGPPDRPQSCASWRSERPWPRRRRPWTRWSCAVSRSRWPRPTRRCRRVRGPAPHG